MRRRRLRRNPDGSNLSITSMMDMMTIILVFLLRDFATPSIVVDTDADLRLVPSHTAEDAQRGPIVHITRQAILLDGVPLVVLAAGDDAGAGADPIRVPADALDGDRIVPLYVAVRALAGPEATSERRTLYLSCDRAVPYAVLRQVARTATDAGHGALGLVVVRDE